MSKKAGDVKAKVRLAEVEPALKKLLPKPTTRTPPQ